MYHHHDVAFVVDDDMMLMITMMILNVDDLKICLMNAKTVLSSLLTGSTDVATATTTEASSSSSSSSASSSSSSASLDSKVGDVKVSYIDLNIKTKINDDDKNTAATTYKPIIADTTTKTEAHSLTKNTRVIYHHFLPFFDAKMKFLEDVKTSQSLTCERMMELLTDRFMILKECISDR